MNKVLDEICPKAMLERISVCQFFRRYRKEGKKNLFLPYEGSWISSILERHTADPEE